MELSGAGEADEADEAERSGVERGVERRRAEWSGAALCERTSPPPELSFLTKGPLLFGLEAPRGAPTLPYALTLRCIRLRAKC